MIVDIELNDEQRRALERGIERLYAEMNVSTCGLEVHSVSSYGAGDYRVFYSYENDKVKDVKTSAFFRFHLSQYHLDSVEFSDTV